MRPLYEVKGYLSTFKEEAPIIQIVSNSEYTPFCALLEILDVAGKNFTDKNSATIIQLGKDLLFERTRQLEDLRLVVEHYDSIYLGLLKNIIAEAAIPHFEEVSKK